MRVQRFVLMMIVATILSFSGVSIAQEKTSSVGAIGESEALNMAQQWALLVSQADIAGIEQLLSDRYVHIHGTALVESKGQFVEALKNGTRKYDPIKIEEANVRVFGDSAVVTGKFDLKAYTRGKTIESINRFGLLLVKTQSGLQVASFQATAIPPQPK